MIHQPKRYYPELARQRCPECGNALATTPYTRLAGNVRVRQHKCPVKGCGAEWKTHELIQPSATIVTEPYYPEPVAPPVKALVAQAKGKRRR